MDNVEQILEWLSEVPPEGAVDYLKSQGYEVSANADEIINAIKNHAFTVAKVATADKLQKIHDELKKAMDSGTPYKEWLKSVKDTVPGKTNWQTVYRTNMSSAYNSGRYVQQLAATEYAPFWQHFCPIDSRTRPLGHTLNGLIYRFDDPHWQAMYPPNEYNDRDRIGVLSDFAMQQQGLKAESEPPRDKDGKLYEPAKGFKGNPANSTWKPDLSKYSPDIRSELEKALGGKEIKPTEGVLKAEGKMVDGYVKAKPIDVFNDLINNNDMFTKLNKASQMVTGKDKAGQENIVLKHIAESQKFTNRPTVLNKAEFEATAHTRGVTVYRGLTEISYMEQFKTGEYYAGRGLYGDGTYGAKNYKETDAYSGETNKCLKIQLNKNAKIGDFVKLQEEAHLGYRQSIDDYIKSTYGVDDFSMLMNIKNPESLNLNKTVLEKCKEAQKLYKTTDVQNKLNVLGSVYGDVGVYAATKGYDAYKVQRNGFYVILNRGACTVQNELISNITGK